MNEELRVEDEPRLQEVAALEDRLYQHNVTVTGCGDGRWLAIFVRHGAGEVMAGLHGWTWGRTGFVRTLWAREDLRGRGIGARLLEEAEREATQRGCRKIELPAPGFYGRPGYEQIGELPGWPSEEATRVFFRKAPTAGE